MALINNSIPRSFLDELIDRCNIVDVVSGYVKLRKTGANYVGLCPFHNEKTPSFTVSAEKQLYKCFGCGAGGNVISFVMNIENLGFVDAVKKLADSCGMVLPTEDDKSFNARKRTLEANVAAAKLWRSNLFSEKGKDAFGYLSRRGMSLESIKAFGIGYAVNGWYDMDTSSAAELMGREQIRRLPVVENGRLCGMISLGDLAVQKESSLDAGDALSGISSGLSSRK
jgi:DNA primase